MEAKVEQGRPSRPGHRRGGFGDAGGFTGGNGSLPEAPPVTVASEGELRGELEHVASQLVPAVEWTARVDALLRLEGLVKGGAAEFGAFPELLLALRDALASQMQERRSAVSRQACHVVGILAAACGMAFEPLGIQLLPVVFKTLAMSIQIVSEAADACAHTILAHCPSQRLLPKLCTTLASDKNGRLRQSAAEFLLRALECWQPTDWERQQEGVEKAVLAAAQDAQAETRAVGRSLFGAYASACPAQTQALLARLMRDKQGQLAEKLSQAAREYVPGAMLPPCPSLLSLSQPSSRRSSLGNGGCRPPAVPKLVLSALHTADNSRRVSPTRSSSARSAAAAAGTAAAAPPAAVACQPSARENLPENPGLAVQCTPHSMFPKTLPRRGEGGAAPGGGGGGDGGDGGEPGRQRLAPRRSLGGAALRMSLAPVRWQQEAGEGTDEDPTRLAVVAGLQRGAGAGAQQRGALRVPVPPPLPPLPGQPAEQARQSAWPLTARRLGPGERPSSSVTEDSEAGSICSNWEDGSGGSAPASLAALLAGLSKGGGVSWGERVSLFRSLQTVLQQSGSSQHAAADVASNTDRMVAALLEGMGDAHFRVASAALAALGAGLAGPSTRLFEPQLDRVMTALFARVMDPKEQIRQLCSAALAEVLHQHSADAIVGAVARSLQANRAPRVKCAVMDYFAAAVSAGVGQQQQPAGEELQQADQQQQQQHVPLLHQLSGTAAALGGLVRSILQLATDKNPDIRRAAADAAAAVCQGGEAQAVMTTVHSLPPADCLAVQRAIGPAIQHRCGDAALALLLGSGSSKSSSSQPSGSLTSRRQSVESGGASRQPSGSLTSRRPASGSSEGSRQGAQSRQQSGSLTARSRHGSQVSSPPPGRQQQQQHQPAHAATAVAAAMPPPAAPAAPASVATAPPPQLTPEPPSPFMWRNQSASPDKALPPAAQQESQKAGNAAAGAAPTLTVAVPAADSAGYGGVPSPTLFRDRLMQLVEQQQLVAEEEAADAQAQAAAQAAAAAPGGLSLGPGCGSDLAPFDGVMAGQLQRLLSQLEQGRPGSEALQGLSRLAHVLPPSAWPPCFDQVMGAVCDALDSGSAVVRDAGLMLTRDLAAAAAPSLFLPALPALLPRLLACAAEQEAREVALAADEALEQLLQRAPPQSCLGLLLPQLPPPGTVLSVDRQAGLALHTAVKNLRRVLARMQPAGLRAHLQPLLMPGLCAAYCSPLADVRKATVDCLVTVWQVVGDGIQPHLEPLSASQMKLLAIYHDKACSRTA